MQSERAAPAIDPLPATGSLQSTTRAFLVLTLISFQRHWRVRQMGWVSVGLLAMVVTIVAVVTARGGWDLAERRPYRGALTYRQYAQHDVLPKQLTLNSAVSPADYGLGPMLLVTQQRLLTSERLMGNWSFLNYTRWAVLGAYLGFVLPLFTMAYASAAFGTERESRSLVWLMTRPVPRSLIYLGKFLGTLPWCVAFGLGGFVAVCWAGGPWGAAALRLYWPAAVAGTVAFAALFHLVGALFRRPVVVGLVYVFFFEAVVAVLPGSLKLLSLSFYARCLMYNGATAAGYPTEMLELIQPVSNATAWWFLGVVTVGLTVVGMWLFSRSEYRDDV